jgi:hypothetical protein
MIDRYPRSEEKERKKKWNEGGNEDGGGETGRR